MLVLQVLCGSTGILHFEPDDQAWHGHHIPHHGTYIRSRLIKRVKILPITDLFL